MTDAADLIAPRARTNFLGAQGLEARLTRLVAAGALANGWLVTGGEGAGKATLAYRLARALLWKERPADAPDLQTPATSRVHALVASGGHPDLFVVERQFDDKKDRYPSEISIDVVRDLTHFLSHTASMGGWRVVIVDTADDLNRNSANALLKALEEPPPQTAILVLSAAPGRLLATIRSRCRRIDLRPLDDDAVEKFLISEGAATDAEAREIAIAAKGRPGFALSLALGEGGDAIDAVEEFCAVASAGRDVGPIAQRLAGKDGDRVWPHFRAMLVSRIAGEARSAAAAQHQAAAILVDLREDISQLFSRGDAVNLDRTQLVLAAGRAFRAAHAPPGH
jgi:DNA polymerase-3 subunit delta'